MKVITINKNYEILNGDLKGANGRAVAFDSIEDEVWINIDEHCSIVTTSENVEEYNGERELDLDLFTDFDPTEST